MSGKIMGQVWDFDLPTNEQLVLLAMADHADHIGENIYPSVGLIAWKTGYSERTIQRLIKSLLKKEILKVQKRRPGKTTIYCTAFENAPLRQPYRSEQTPDIDVTPDTIDVTPTPDIQMSPEPSLEPSTKIKDSTPSGVILPELQETPSPEETAKSENKAIGDLIKVWLEEQSIIDSKAYSKTGYRSVAKDLHRAGVTPDDLKGFLTYYNAQGFWKDKAIPWSYVQANIQKWKELQSTPPPKTKHDIAMERLAKGLPYAVQ